MNDLKLFFSDVSDDPLKLSIVITVYVLGLVCAALAVLRSRTPQGATAWIMALISFPLIAVPLYLLFGKSKFDGYNMRRRFYDQKVQQSFDSLNLIEDGDTEKSDNIRLITATISEKNQPGFTGRNSIKLLIDGKETFPAMLEAIDKAENYILLQSYIFRGDQIGRKFVNLLVRKALLGVKVSILNDDIGGKIPKDLIREMEEAGIKVGSFNNSHGRGRLQVNFRNHRKILIVDGKVGFVGGLNIGDDYLGLWPKYGPWRDTHVQFSGPSVIASQLAFAKDWYCVFQEPVQADWRVHPSSHHADVMVLHTGPADHKNTCLLAHVALINSARERLWIANPYIVPPESLQDAIILAALRGVDVRIIAPSYTDAKTVLLASRVYLEKFLKHGIRIYSYTGGFLHQKTMLVDDAFGVVSSANFDYRSMFINFEITAIASDDEFIMSMEKMLKFDFGHSRLLHPDELANKTIFQQIVRRGANLMAPVL